MPMDIAQEVLQDLKSDIEYTVKTAETVSKSIMIVINTLKGLGIDDVMQNLAAKKEQNQLVGTLSSQIKKTLKDFSATATGEKLPSFEQISIKHSITYAVYQDKTNPGGRIVCMASNRGNSKDLKNAVLEYSEKSRNRKPSIKVRLAEAQKQSAALNAKNLAKNLSQSIPKPKMPLPKM